MHGTEGYLHGVDTVKDAILSAQLLDIASQKGQIDATEKLVQMYRYGVGVKRDIEKALAFQERLITQHQQRYLEDNNIHAWNEVFQAFIFRGDILEDEKKHSDTHLFGRCLFAAEAVRRRNASI